MTSMKGFVVFNNRLANTEPLPNGELTIFLYSQPCKSANNIRQALCTLKYYPELTEPEPDRSLINCPSLLKRCMHSIFIYIFVWTIFIPVNAIMFYFYILILFLGNNKYCTSKDLKYKERKSLNSIWTK